MPMRSLRRPRFLAPAVAATVALPLAACGGGSGGEQTDYVLHYSTYTAPSADQSITVRRWAEEVERLTDGGVSIRFHYSETLVDADESVQAALDGRVDLTQVGSIYAASDLSMFTAVELPFETDNPQVQMTAIQRLYEENETFREDFDRQGVKLLFPLPLGNALLGARAPVQDVADLRGQSIRAGGLLSEVVLAAGANPVAMTANDVYESLERGVVDGYTALGLANLPTFGLGPVTPHVLDPGVGAYSSSIVIMNEDLFNEMPAEYQDAIMQASAGGIDLGLEELDAAGTIGCEQLRDAGADFSALDQDEVDALQDEAGIAEAWVARYAERGYDAESVLADYRRIIEEETARADYLDPLTACMQED